MQFCTFAYTFVWANYKLTISAAISVLQRGCHCLETPALEQKTDLFCEIIWSHLWGLDFQWIINTCNKRFKQKEKGVHWSFSTGKKSIPCIIKYKETYVLSFISPQLIITLQKLEAGLFFIKQNVGFPWATLCFITGMCWRVPVPSSSGEEGWAHPSHFT